MVHEEAQSFFWEVRFSRSGFGFQFQINTHTPPFGFNNGHGSNKRKKNPDYLLAAFFLNF